MATLERPRTAPAATSIANGVPSPFPTELLERQEERGHAPGQNPFISPAENEETDVQTSAREQQQQERTGLVRRIHKFSHHSLSERRADRNPSLHRYPAKIMHHNVERSARSKPAPFDAFNDWRVIHRHTGSPRIETPFSGRRNVTID